MNGYTLDLIGELLQRTQRDIADIKDQLIVQGAILLRLEARGDDRSMAAMQQQILRLERRVKELEER